MYTVIFTYNDNTEMLYSNINKIVYFKSSMVTVEKEAIETHNFPLHKDYYLFGNGTNHSASGDSLRSITIKKGN